MNRTVQVLFPGLKVCEYRTSRSASPAEATQGHDGKDTSREKRPQVPAIASHRDRSLGALHLTRRLRLRNQQGWDQPDPKRCRNEAQAWEGRQASAQSKGPARSQRRAGTNRTQRTSWHNRTSRKPRDTGQRWNCGAQSPLRSHSHPNRIGSRHRNLQYRRLGTHRLDLGIKCRRNHLHGSPKRKKRMASRDRARKRGVDRVCNCHLLRLLGGSSGRL